MRKHTGLALVVAGALLLPQLPVSAATYVMPTLDGIDMEELLNRARSMASWSSSSATSASTSRSVSSIPASSSASSRSSSSQSSTSTNLSSIRQRIIDLVNSERRANGLSPLSSESHLTSAAQTHAQDMYKMGKMSHTNSAGQSPTQQISTAGYPLTGQWYTGQNVARGQTTPEQVMRDWMNSPGHKKNILSPNFRDIGVGFYNNYWVQDFGSHQ